MAGIQNRCRIVLISPAGPDMGHIHEQTRLALSGGDVASVIIAKGDLDELHYAKHAEAMVPVVQSAGAAALMVDDTRTMGRCNADGMFVGSDIERLIETVGKLSPQKITGYGGAKDRHNALIAGDAGPDFIFFGRIDGDIKPEAHLKNLDLAKWWTPLIEVPCVVMAGSEIESVLEVAKTGAEFVAINRAIFEHKDGPAEAVRSINKLLDEHAPLLEQEA